MIEGTDQSAYI